MPQASRRRRGARESEGAARRRRGRMRGTHRRVGAKSARSAAIDHREDFILKRNFVAYGIGTMPVKEYATAEEKVKAIQEYQRRYHERHRCYGALSPHSLHHSAIFGSGSQAQ